MAIPGLLGMDKRAGQRAATHAVTVLSPFARYVNQTAYVQQAGHSYSGSPFFLGFLSGISQLACYIYLGEQPTTNERNWVLSAVENELFGPQAQSFHELAERLDKLKNSDYGRGLEAAKAYHSLYNQKGYATDFSVVAALYQQIEPFNVWGDHNQRDMVLALMAGRLCEEMVGGNKYDSCALEAA